MCANIDLLKTDNYNGPCCIPLEATFNYKLCLLHVSNMHQADFKRHQASQLLSLYEVTVPFALVFVRDGLYSRFQNSRWKLYWGQSGARYWSAVWYKQLARCTQCCVACPQPQHWTMAPWVSSLLGICTWFLRFVFNLFKWSNSSETRGHCQEIPRKIIQVKMNIFLEINVLYNEIMFQIFWYWK